MGRVICTGLGPGVPDLMSLRAARAIAAAPQAAWTRKQGRNGLARAIVKGMLATDTLELPMVHAVTTELRIDSPSFARRMQWGDHLAEPARSVSGRWRRPRDHEFHYTAIGEQPDAPIAHVVDANGETVPEPGSTPRQAGGGLSTGPFIHLIAEAA